MINLSGTLLKRLTRLWGISVGRSCLRDKDMVSLGISKAFLAFMAFYVSYLLIGGYLFQFSECPSEMHLKSKDAALKREFLVLFSNLERIENLRSRRESPSNFATILENDYPTLGGYSVLL